MRITPQPGLPPSLFSARRLSASEIFPPPRLPGEDEVEGEPFGLDLLALGGADPLPLVLSRPTPPRQQRQERGRKQAGPPLHLRAAPPTATPAPVAGARVKTTRCSGALRTPCR